MGQSSDSKKPYIPNYHVRFTPETEIKRLQKVIDEKNALIAKFKEYDTRRSDEFRRLQQNYKLMEERFEEFNNAIDACDGIDDSKEFFKSVINRLYVHIADEDTLMSVIYKNVSLLEKMKDVIGNLECAISCVGNIEKRSALYDELKELIRLHSKVYTSLNKAKKIK